MKHSERSRGKKTPLHKLFQSIFRIGGGNSVMDRRGNIVRKPGKRSRDIKQETMYLNQEFTEKQSRMIFMPQA